MVRFTSNAVFLLAVITAASTLALPSGYTEFQSRSEHDGLAVRDVQTDNTIMGRELFADEELYARDFDFENAELFERDFDEEELFERDAEEELFERDAEEELFERDAEEYPVLEARKNIFKKIGEGIKKAAHKVGQGIKKTLPVVGEAAEVTSQVAETASQVAPMIKKH